MIRKKLIMWCAGAVIALSPFVSHATETASSLTLQEAIERTLAYSSDVKRVDAELAERYAEAFENSVLGNPEAEIDAAFVDGSTPGRSMELEQPLRLSDFGRRFGSGRKSAMQAGSIGVGFYCCHGCGPPSSGSACGSDGSSSSSKSRPSPWKSACRSCSLHSSNTARRGSRLVGSGPPRPDLV